MCILTTTNFLRTCIWGEIWALLSIPPTNKHLGNLKRKLKFKELGSKKKSLPPTSLGIQLINKNKWWDAGECTLELISSNHPFYLGFIGTAASGHNHFSSNELRQLTALTCLLYKIIWGHSKLWGSVISQWSQKKGNCQATLQTVLYSNRKVKNKIKWVIPLTIC